MPTSLRRTLPLILSIALCAVPFVWHATAADTGAVNAKAAAPVTTTVSSTTKSTTKATSKPVPAKWVSRPFPPDEVNLIVMGDFGNGKTSQKKTATTMISYVEKQRVQFNAALTVGDNFYVKMRDVDDYQFQSLFEDMYDARVMNFPFYVSTGNHDWERTSNGKTKVLLEMEYTHKHPQSRWKYPSMWHRVDFPQGSSEPLVTALLLESSMPRLGAELWEEQKRWIEQQLSSSKAKWKVACAHHPFFSNGSHGDNGMMQWQWGPIFKKHGLDIYFAGHDHDLQHLEIPGWPVSFVQAGGGGQGITDMRRDARGPFSRKLHGFVHAKFTPDTAEVKFIARADGAPAHTFRRDDASGRITVVQTTGRDKPTTKPLKTLLGLREADIKPTTKPKPILSDEDEPEDDNKLNDAEVEKK